MISSLGDINMAQLFFDMLKAVAVIVLLSLLAGLLMTVALVIFFLLPGRDMDFQINYTVSIVDVGIWISALATSLALVYAYQGYVVERRKSKVEELRARLVYALFRVQDSQERLNELEEELKGWESQDKGQSDSYYERIRRLFNNTVGPITEVSNILVEYKQFESTILIRKDIEQKLESIKRSSAKSRENWKDFEFLSSQRRESDETERVKGKYEPVVNLTLKSQSLHEEREKLLKMVISMKNSQLTVIQHIIEEENYRSRQIDPIYRRILEGTSAKNYEMTVFDDN